MIRYLATGTRNFKKNLDVSAKRLNWTFFVLVKGTAHPVFVNPSYTFPPHSNFWIIPPGVSHVFRQSDNKPCLRSALHVTRVPPLLQEAVLKQRLLALCLKPDELAQAHAWIGELGKHYYRPNQLSVLHCDRTVTDLALLALKDASLLPSVTIETLGVERVEHAIAWYCEHMHENPTLLEVCAAVHISPSHIRSLFHKIKEKSPSAVFTQLRLERACDILSTTALTLDQVAANCCFRSATDFCRVFKKHYAISPNVWRRTVHLTEDPQSNSRWRSRGSHALWEGRVVGPSSHRPSP